MIILLIGFIFLLATSNKLDFGQFKKTKINYNLNKGYNLLFSSLNLSIKAL